MLANIENFLRQDVNIPKTKALLPVFECVSNALDAIADRSGKGTVRITVLRHPTQLDGSLGAPKDIVIEDDGVGFTNENAASFCELFSPRKSSVGGKGRGRFTYLKVFERARITSCYLGEDGSSCQRAFAFDASFKGEIADGLPFKGPAGTRVVLESMREPYAAEVPKTFDALLRRVIWHFLPTLLATRNIEIILEDEGQSTRIIDYLRDTLQIDTREETFKVGVRDFLLTHIRFHPRADVKHRLIMAAAAREVEDGFKIASRIPLLAHGPLQSDDTADGFVYVALLQGTFLDEMADPLRLGFGREDAAEIDADDEAEDDPRAEADLLSDPRSVRDVRAEAVRRIKAFLDPYLTTAIAARAEAISAYIRKDGMAYHFIRDAVQDVARTLKRSDDDAIEEALHKRAYREKRASRKDVSRLLAATPKEKAESAYFSRWQKIVDSVSQIAKSELANYVAHRRAVLDLVDDLLKAADGDPHRREEVLHSVIFPKGTQSGEVGFEQQNLWLIDERLAFHEHLFSDKAISRITDGEVPALARPDLTIFESGFASFSDGARPPANLVLVELKRPARTDASRDDPYRTTLDYVKKLKSGRAYTESNQVIEVRDGALTTVYILSDWTADFRQYLDDEDFKSMPGELCRYKYHDKQNIMFVAISFQGLIEGARMRNRVFFKKLGIE